MSKINVTNNVNNVGVLNSSNISNSYNNSITHQLGLYASNMQRIDKAINHNCLNCENTFKIKFNEYNEININEIDINNTLYDVKIFNTLLTIKDILIEKQIVSEEEYNKVYKDIENKLKEKVMGVKVLKKLTD
jgi:hypothetical protein